MKNPTRLLQTRRVLCCAKHGDGDADFGGFATALVVDATAHKDVGTDDFDFLAS